MSRAVASLRLILHWMRQRTFVRNHRSKIATINPGDHHDLVGLALQLVLQDGKVRGAICSWYDHFAVDDRRTGTDMPRLVGDLPEALGPVIAAAGEDLYRCVSQMDLNAIAVELDFMDPARAAGTFSIDVASAGSINPGKGAFTPIAAGFLR
jgi:hypothetical protein